MRHLAAVIALCIAASAIAVPPPDGFDPRPILDAIRWVETRDRPDANDAVGDNGKALGAYQVHRVFWLDAVEHDPSLVANGETYQNVRDPAYAERVILAYWSRYAPAYDSQTLARIHNGGPRGHKKAATLDYWRKVKERMDARVPRDGRGAVAQDRR